jgi:hypothetical protein
VCNNHNRYLFQFNMCSHPINSFYLVSSSAKNFYMLLTYNECYMDIVEDILICQLHAENTNGAQLSIDRLSNMPKHSIVLLLFSPFCCDITMTSLFVFCLKTIDSTTKSNIILRGIKHFS